MGISIEQKPEMNVVNVGDELTTDQLAALQNAQGASATNPVLTRTNTFNTADAAVRITQEGTGEAFRIEDAANPDSSPFVITSDGNVGIGTASINAKLVVNGGAIFSGISGGTLYNFTQNGTGTLAVFANNATSTADAVRITNLGTGNSFVVEDDTNPDTTPFLISSSGDVAIGTNTPNGKLRVTGRSYFENTSGAGGNAVVWARSSASTGVPIVQVTGDPNHLGAGAIIELNNTASTADAVRITNLGTGNSFVVEDSTNPDSTPFVIDAAGRVAIGASSAGTSALLVSSTAGKASFNGGAAVSGNLECATVLVSSRIDISTSTTTNPALLISQSGTTDAVRITNLGTGNSFVVEDSSSDTTTFVIDNAGNVTLGGSLTLASGAYAANAALVIDNTNYPHELEFKVGSTIYRVPARAI